MAKTREKQHSCCVVCSQTFYGITKGTMRNHLKGHGLDGRKLRAALLKSYGHMFVSEEPKNK